jgi:hypothetical protein
VQAALDAGYSEIRSVEANKAIGAGAQLRFRDDPRVSIYIHDSAPWLQMVLRLCEPSSTTIWLDAHATHAPVPELEKSDPCPLLAELDAIRVWSEAELPVIMVDDFDALGTSIFHQRAGKEGCAPGQDVIREAIRWVGPYSFLVEDTERPGKLLVAVPSE